MINKQIFRYIVYIYAFFSVSYGMYGQNPAGDIQARLTAAGFQIPRQSFAAPPFAVRDLHNKLHDINNYKGQLVLINLWATWCPPCREEMPSMEKLYNRYSSQGFVILASSADILNDHKQNVEKFAENLGLSFPILFDDANGIDPNYMTGSIPVSYIVNKDGLIIARLIGAIDWYSDAVKSIIEELL